jgi:general nucleoside transport system permease protein
MSDSQKENQSARPIDSQIRKVGDHPTSKVIAKNSAATLVSTTRTIFSSLMMSLLAVSVGLVLGGILAAFAGESPLHVIQVIVTGAFGTPYDVGMVLYYSSLLIGTGLAVAIPFQAGIFNIGAEGQTLMGAMAAALAGAYAPAWWPLWLAVPSAFFAAMVAAGLWGGIAGAIRAFRGGHEVIGSIMLNFVAAGLTGWLVVEKFQATETQNPETAMIQDSFRLIPFESFGGAPVTSAIFVALFAAFIFWLVLEKSRMGLRLKAVRQSPEAAVVAGFDVNQVRFWAFTMGSAACGIAGAAMVLGASGRFRMEMSDGFGFLGIPVALLGRGRPMGIIMAAFLFAGLHHGASALDLEATKVTRDLAQVIEALVVLSVIAQASLQPRLIEKLSSLKLAVNRWPIFQRGA